MADRPGDIHGAQPEGDRFGTPGPDQGYAIKLAGSFSDRLRTGKLSHNDVVSGCVAVAIKRSGAFGRGPVVHDLTAAFTIWGFLDSNPASDLVELREELFPQIASSHHYAERREVADMVPSEVLARPHSLIIEDYGADWRNNITQHHSSGH